MTTKKPAALARRTLPNGTVIHTLKFTDGCQIDFITASLLTAYIHQHDIEIVF